MGLPEPKLTEITNGQVPYFTDCALFAETGVRVAFTERQGGVSAPPFAELNLSEYVGDDQEAVSQNRHIALESVGGKHCSMLVPKQVHGQNVAVLLSNDEAALGSVRNEIEQGADGLVIAADDVAVMLGFADCIPVIMAAPNRAFAVVHAGWRGVMQRIAPKALRMLCSVKTYCDGPSSETDPFDVNIYIGPHIHGECFETSQDIHSQFVSEFGDDVSFDATHIDLNRALRSSLVEAGANLRRIADVGSCTMCDSDKFFSYRASGGTCGRHGAIAYREPI